MCVSNNDRDDYHLRDNTVAPPNNGHAGDECFVHYSEVVPSSEVLTCIQLLAGGTQFVHCPLFGMSVTWPMKLCEQSSLGAMCCLS